MNTSRRSIPIAELAGQGRRVALALLAIALLANSAHAAATKTTVAIPMRDGKTLAADVYTPTATRGPWPVIVVQTPYDRRTWEPIFTIDQNTDPLFKNPNYAWVFVDWRGFFGSAASQYSGCPTRGQDGYDVVEWAAAQTFSNGKVGAWGVSALGTAILATAQEAPPHLVAAVPIEYYWRESYALSYPGGVYYKNRNDSPFGNGYLSSGHPLYDSWWSQVESTSNPINKVNIPMLHVSGWFDHLTDATLAEMQRVQSGGAAGAAGKQKAFIGPWTHGHVTDAQQGALSFPDAATMQANAALEFFDYQLRALANGYDQRATYRYYQTNEARVVDSASWPPSNTTAQTYYLRGDATLAAAAPSATETPRSYVADPTNAVPTLCGAVLDDKNASTGPCDLRSVEARSDVLSFTTAPLASALAITGRPRVRLNVTSTAADTDLAVRITDVRPDGTSMLIVDSIKRVSLRNGYTSKQTLTPGTIYAVDLDLPSIALTIPAGDRLRVLVAPSNFDRFDKNMQDGTTSLSTSTSAVATRATIQVVLDSAHASTITLPTTSAVVATPAAPTKLAATVASSSAINLSWTDGSSNETGFMVERSTDNVTFAAVASVSANNTTFADSGLSSSTTYYYRVHAFNSAGDSPNTTVVSATTKLAPPAAPTNLVATSVLKNQATLTWTDNATNETNYKVMRSTDGKNFLLFGTLSPNTTTFTNTGLLANKTYYFRVYALNSAGSSANSNTITIKTPSK